MNCKNCNGFMPDEASNCPNCGTPVDNAQPQYQQQPPQQPQYQQQNFNSAPMPAPKSKAIAALLAFFLGTLGIHNFYLGNTTKGIIQLSLTLFASFCGPFLWVPYICLIAVGLWAFVEFIMILVGSFKDGNGQVV